jgi:hypothetical protein
MSVATAGHWPYEYKIDVPVTNRFVILAIAYERLQDRPPAVVAYPAAPSQVCSLKSELPQPVWRLDSPPQHWGDNVTYDCENCPSNLPTTDH